MSLLFCYLFAQNIYTSVFYLIKFVWYIPERHPGDGDRSAIVGAVAAIPSAGAAEEEEEKDEGEQAEAARVPAVADACAVAAAAAADLQAWRPSCRLPGRLLRGLRVEKGAGHSSSASAGSPSSS